MSFAIDSHIPVPTQQSSCKYPYGSLEVGQSFLAADGNASSIRSGASQFGKRNNKKFRVSKTREGIRVWRTA